MQGFAAERADAIYRTGPETATANASSVATGTVSSLARDVMSATAGIEAVPVTWTARGRLTNVRALKGQYPGDGLSIQREEQAVFAMQPSAEPYWTIEYGALNDGGNAVVFLGEDDPLVVPSGLGELDLARLVQHAAEIAAMPDAEAQREAQLGWLAEGETDAERKAALRLAMHGGASWDEVAGTLQSAWPSAGPQLRQFLTGATGFGIIEGLWPAEDVRPLTIMCNVFMVADDSAATGAMLQLKQVLVWTERDEADDARAALGERILHCYRDRLSKPVGSELQAYFDQLDPKYGLR